MGTVPTEEQIRNGPIRDLEPDNNTLSVWYIEDDRSNLERVAVALASTRDTFSNFDYALVDEQLLSALNIKVVQTDGITPDQEANTQWHRDLVELSDADLIALARTIEELLGTAKTDIVVAVAWHDPEAERRAGVRWVGRNSTVSSASPDGYRP